MNNSLEAGRRPRRSRAATVPAVVVAVFAVVVPAAHASQRVPTRQPSAVRPAPSSSWPVAYFAAGSQIVPVRTRTWTTEKPMKVPAATATNMAIASDGKGYLDGVLGELVPVDLISKTARPPILIRDATGPVAITPDGRTAYAVTAKGLLPVDVASNRVGKLIRLHRGFNVTALAMTPDSRILYAVGVTQQGRRVSTEIVPVMTASNKALRPIALGRTGWPAQALVTPDGKTLVVLNMSSVFEECSVTQISVTTGKPRPRVRIPASGEQMVLSPAGTTAYVLSNKKVTPINLVTNTARPAIKFRPSSGDPINLVITPNGKRLYVLTADQIIPISTARRTVFRSVRVANLDWPVLIAMNPNGKELYVGRGGEDEVVPVSTATDRSGRPISFGGTGRDARAWVVAFLP